jgi:TolB protein
MQHLSRLFLLVALLVTPTFAQPTRKLGEIRVEVDNATIPVRITSASPELQSLALAAFNTHGRYDVSGRRPPAYQFRFTSVGGTQVRVEILKGSAATPVDTQTVNGTSARNALMRAADIVVEKTSGVPGLRGYFTTKLAFVSQRSGRSEVYAAELGDLLAGSAKQLTHDGAHVMSPHWTPDGSRIIFTSFFKTGMPDIFLLDPGSGRKDTFVSVKGTNMGARYSPNGQQVAMVLTGEGSHEIYVSNAQGRQITRKTHSDVVKASPCWSPDGSQIVFAMGEPAPQLYVMSAAGGAPRRLFSGFSYASEPDWSRADRNKIACTVKDGGKYQIAVVDASAGKATVVSKAPFDGIEPSWLPDGRHVVYTARDRHTSVLCILDTETGKSARITPDNANAMQGSVWGR